MPESSPLFWPVSTLIRSYEAGDISPVEVAEEALERTGRFDAVLHSYLTVTPDLALRQARAAERAYRDGDGGGRLLGIPMAVKDLFDIEGVTTTLGSLVFRNHVARSDSKVVANLRSEGAVFIGKSNTAEFGQSATTENLLTLGCANPWNTSMTTGGSSGGSAAAVAAGLASVALGSDGGGSIRIPSAFTGLFGIKPTYGRVGDDSPFRAMTEFACPGPMARTVADARPVLGALLREDFPRAPTGSRRIAWCPQPQGRPVDPDVTDACERAVRTLADLGHDVTEIELPLEGWTEAFGPLVLADEWRERRDLLVDQGRQLTRYARRSIQGGAKITDDDLSAAREHLGRFRADVRALFGQFDLVVTPTTATTAFPLDTRPASVHGAAVDALWGAFPFTAPFNVAGNPAVSVPCGLSGGLPIGLQLVAAHGREQLLLDVSEDLEEELGFPSERLAESWGAGAVAGCRGHVTVERDDASAVIRINRPEKRGALSKDLLRRLAAAFRSEIVRTAPAVILTGSGPVFSAGADLTETGKGADDLSMDEAVSNVVSEIRGAGPPVIAAVEGPCLGAAVELALACDVLICDESASFGIPATRLGILYKPAALRELAHRLGHQTASRLLLFGETFDAGAALESGIVAKRVPAGGALGAAKGMAAMAAESLPAATAATKSVLQSVQVAGPDNDSAIQETRVRLLAERAERIARKRNSSSTVDARV